MIQTLSKKISIKDIKGKFNFAHEHLSFDLTHIRQDKYSKSLGITAMVEELSMAKKLGLGLVVDLSNHSMNPDITSAHTISRKLNVPVVATTGFYMNDYETKNNMTIKEMTDLFIKDLTSGIGNTHFKAGIIGEIGTSSDKVHSFEKRVFEAAAIAHKVTGAAIYTHVDLGNHALEQAKMLSKFGVAPDRVIIGHAEFLKLAEIEKLLNDGFNIGIDTIGKNNYMNDNDRLQLLTQLLSKGWEDQIVLSLDISKQTYLKQNGGHGYQYLHEFINRLPTSISQKQIYKISFFNILKIIDVKE